MAHAERGRLVYQDEDGLLDLPRAEARPAATSSINAGAAIAALRAAGLALCRRSAFEAGLGSAEWPARLQRLAQRARWPSSRRPAAELWLDGGHNPDGGARHRRRRWPISRNATAAAGPDCRACSHQDPVGFLQALRRAWCAARGDRAGADVDARASRWNSPRSRRDVGLPRPRGAGSVAEAIDAVIERGQRDGAAAHPDLRSLYLAGSVLAENASLRSGRNQALPGDMSVKRVPVTSPRDMSTAIGIWAEQRVENTSEYRQVPYRADKTATTIYASATRISAKPAGQTAGKLTREMLARTRFTLA